MEFFFIDHDSLKHLHSQKSLDNLPEQPGRIENLVEQPRRMEKLLEKSSSWDILECCGDL
ncbi:hypothetical protein ACOSQ3_033283 [Xanthoceras sorbifolium]